MNIEENRVFLQEVRDSRLAATTKTAYTNASARFLQFLGENRIELPNCLRQNFRIQLDNADNKGRFCRQWIINHESNESPVEYSLMDHDTFANWIASLKRANGGRLGKSSYNTGRSAFRYLFEIYNEVFPAELDAQLSQTYKGLKKIIAQREGRGEDVSKSGKDNLEFSFYQVICKELLSTKKKEDIFSHFFIILSWNLLSRSSNIVNLHWNHFQWVEDSMAIIFSHAKNDQCGNNSKVPRHVYANPKCPAICPVLSLGLYLLTFPLDSLDLRVFPGSNQYERFTKRFEFLLKNNLESELARRGKTVEDYGSHSMRKGATSYCSNGSIQCPPIVAINIRGGWSMGKIQDTYMRYESAGDMFVGRTACGLQPASREFCLLPPYFINDELIPEIIRECIPNCPSRLNRVVSFALESVIYHYDYLKSILGSSHFILRSSLFSDRERLQLLKENIYCGYANDNSIRPTGIPGHLDMLNSLSIISENVEKIIPAIVESTNATAELIINELEQKTVGLGTVTYQGLADNLRNTVENVLRQNGIIGNQINSLNHPVVDEQSNEQNDLSPQLFYYNGSYHRIPENFHFNGIDGKCIYKMWHFGIPQERICPFNQLTGRDMPNRNLKRRLSDLKRFIRKIEQKANELEVAIIPQNIVQCNENYDIVIRELASGRHGRDLFHLAWRSINDII